MQVLCSMYPCISIKHPKMHWGACKSFERALPQISSRLNALFGWAFNHIPGYVAVCWQWPVPISKALSGPLKQEINSNSNHLITLGKVAQPHSFGKSFHVHIWTILLRNYCLAQRLWSQRLIFLYKHVYLLGLTELIASTIFIFCYNMEGPSIQCKHTTNQPKNPKLEPRNSISKTSMWESHQYSIN